MAGEPNEAHEVLLPTGGLVGQEAINRVSGSVAVDASSVDDQRMDSNEVERLYREYGTSIQAFLCGILKDSELAREALQNTFQRCLEVGHTAQPETIRGWLFQVAMNEALALKRNQASRDRGAEKYGLHWRGIIEAEMAALPPEQLVMRREEYGRLHEELRRLPEEQRQVVQSRIYEGKTFAVIAAELQIPLGTVLTRMRLAMARLTLRMNSESARSAPPDKKSST